MDRRMYHYRRAAEAASNRGGGHVKAEDVDRDKSVVTAAIDHGADHAGPALQYYFLERIPTQCRPTTDGLHDPVQVLLSAS